ncbi:hypothetical protein WICMUC_000148 [Wickerhamomyces mucosus]|uniref:Zn(2)-C6 fungal-type domain-containing protein n=1 Tax=Wickerhamomyces mucosus TaxID=1378264 RepID=A0A9P8PZ18_9ASCO|nr:hypothetical protein WICMUC_000148 [Wickerhamomyces mucosus]
MSIVCTNCKARKIKCDKSRPSCGNCNKANVGHLCYYEEPHWVNKIIVKREESNEKKLSTSSSVTYEQDLDKINDNGNDSIKLNRDDITDNRLIFKELQRLKNQVSKLESLLNIDNNNTNDYQNSSLIQNNISEDIYNETVDFHNYNSLTYKRSSMEEEKPLASTSCFKNDPYLLLMVGYYNLCKTLSTNIKCEDLNPKIKSQKKKKRLDHSLIQSLYLLGEHETPEISKIVSKFVKERLPKTDPRNDIGLEFDNDDDLLKLEIEKNLPNFQNLKLYFQRFKDLIYPLFPFIDLKSFENLIFNSLIKIDDDDNNNNDQSKVKIIINDKFDYIHLATFLIILRLTYISKPNQFGEDSKLLSPIGSNFIKIALNCISFFKIVRKTKLCIIQALLYLKIYFNLSPEDGDGSKLSQSYILMGNIINSSYVIGMNKDPSLQPQTCYDKDLCNLLRRLWYGLMEIDGIYSIISGHYSLIHQDSYNVKLITNDDNDDLEVEIFNQFIKSQQILKNYQKLSQLINNLSQNPNVSQILKILQNLNSLTMINYSIDDLKNFQNKDFIQRQIIFLQNLKILQFNLQTKSINLSIYQNLSIIYESNNYNDGEFKIKNFQLKSLKLSIEISNLIYKILKFEYNEFIDKGHEFYLNRLIENSIQRVSNFLTSILLRLYHSIDLLKRNIGNLENLSSLNELILLISKITFGINSLIQKSLGYKYYQVFKNSLSLKFLLRSIDKDGYKCIKDTVWFINEKLPTDPSLKFKLLQKIQLKSKPENILKELDCSNFFINLNNVEIDQFKKISKTSKILNDKDLSIDGLIWENSFNSNNNLNENNENNNNNIINEHSLQNILNDTHELSPSNNDENINKSQSSSSNIDLLDSQVLSNPLEFNPNLIPNSNNLINLDQFINDKFLDFDSLLKPDMFSFD